MASTYGYITVAVLENYSGINYGACRGAYSDATVDANITQAELFVNSYTGQSYTSTFPDEVTLVTTEVAYNLMRNRMIDDKIVAGDKLFPVLTDDHMAMLDKLLDKNTTERTIWWE